jgi:endonuclease YncB( thermonuclease family)
LAFRLYFLVVVLALAGAGAAAAQSISGPVRVIDADTLDVGGTRVRLHGIDAQEIGQMCELADGRRWACGAWASARVRSMFQGAWAVCERRDTDHYGRAVARCRVDGADIGARLVREGLAEAYRRYSLDYVDAEKAAFFAGRGIWRGRVEAPEAYRSGLADPAPRQAGRGCAIKGNISANGRIYHLPGQHDYAATRISPRQGERWFCTVAEARAAGWRPALR